MGDVYFFTGIAAKHMNYPEDWNRADALSLLKAARHWLPSDPGVNSMLASLKATADRQEGA